MGSGNGGGYSFTKAALDDIVTKLRGANTDMVQAIKGMPPAPYAGESSDAVGAALKAILQATATAGYIATDAASKVHDSAGSYDTTENNNTGKMQRTISTNSYSNTDPNLAADEVTGG